MALFLTEKCDALHILQKEISPTTFADALYEGNVHDRGVDPDRCSSLGAPKGLLRLLPEEELAKRLMPGVRPILAGEVKARGERRRVRSDWMAVERERGISVSSAVMSFEHEGSPSTCSTRRATGIQREHVLHPDRGRQRGDGARHRLQWHQGGIEEQTREVFEVCRLRDVPIITFVNKLDREGSDPFDLLDEIEQSLALDVTPASWPIGVGRNFLGTYDLFADALLLFERGVHNRGRRTGPLQRPRRPETAAAIAESRARQTARGGRDGKGGCARRSTRKPIARTNLTPINFGSALNNFGVPELLRGVAELAPAPRPQPAEPRAILPEEPKVAGFVFKVQANIDPQHRDRIAFVRISSGRFQGGIATPSAKRSEGNRHDHRAL
jgi:peptide chain release factor 3